MRIYNLKSDIIKFQTLTFSKESDAAKILDFFTGIPIKEKWFDIQTKIYLEGDKPKKPASDFPSFGAGRPILSAKAVEALKDILLNNGEILPITLEGKKDSYYAFNTTTIIDALDEEKSIVTRFKNGSVMQINKYEFIPDKLKGLTIFKIPQLVRNTVYVTDKFVTRVKKENLTGFDFILSWNK